MADANAPVKLLVADVDGTLLDPNKQLTEAVRQSVLKVKEAGVLFTIISARPPRGTHFLIEALDITEPFACFNGAIISSPRYDMLAEIFLDEQTARQVAKTILVHGMDLWMFHGSEWYATKPDGPHTPGHIKLLERTPLLLEPDIVSYKHVNKLVGVSDDWDLVKRCQADVMAQCGDRISATRSSDYYLDVTDAKANKGHAVLQLAEMMRVPLENVASIGDMPTDMLMFAKTGLSIAMGNGSDEVKKAATFTTTSNAEDGFAKAMKEIILPRIADPAGVQR